MKSSLISKLADKHSSPDKQLTAGRGNAMAFAHYLGLPGRVTEAVKAAPGKVQAAAAKLTRKAAASPAPKAATPEPAARATAAAVPMTASSQAAKDAIKADRARSRRIIETGMKLGAPNQAIVYAFDTNLTADEAVAALKASEMDRAEQSAEAHRAGSYRMGVTSAAATDTRSRFDPKEAAARIVAAGEKAAGRATPNASSNRTANRIIAAGERALGE